jgi:hypothetical protein
MTHELSPGDKQAIVQSLWTTWNRGGAALDQLPQTIKTLLDTEAWRDREVDGKPFHNDTFYEFIRSPPLKGCGWGNQIDAIERVLGLRDLDVLRRWREALSPPCGPYRARRRTIDRDAVRDLHAQRSPSASDCP